MKMFAAAAIAAAMLLTPATANADTGDRERLVDRPIKYLWQNNLIWFGKQNKMAPPQQIILRQVTRPWLEQRGWFKNANREACVFGVTRLVGPYGTSTLGISRGCA